MLRHQDMVTQGIHNGENETGRKKWEGARLTDKISNERLRQVIKIEKVGRGIL